MNELPFRNPNEIFLRSKEWLLDRGYKTGEVITLPETGILVDLGHNFYRCLGPFSNPDDLVESAIQTYEEQGFIREDAILLAAAKNLSHDNNNSKLEGGYVLPTRYFVDGKVSQVVSKATTVQPIEGVRVYVEAHEEGHVIDHLRMSHVLQPWFSERGFSRVDVDDLAKKQDPEYLACAVGLATLLSRGIPLEEARILTEKDIRREIHSELIHILEEERE